MLLTHQLQAMIYHIVMGWIYACMFHLLSCITLYFHHRLTKGILEIIFHCVYVLLMYYGLYQITYGASSPYLFLIFLGGCYLYQRFYRPVFHSPFLHFVNFLIFPIRKLKVVKNKIFVIMVRGKEKRRRKKNGKKKDTSKKKKKQDR